MNIAVSFSLRLLKTCLIYHLGFFKTLRPLFTELSHFISFFKHFSSSKCRIYINQNMFNLSSPQDQVSYFIVNNAYFVKLKVNVQL